MTQSHADRERRACPKSGPGPTSEVRIPEAPVTREEFSAGFERCFGRVYAYVNRHVEDRESCERIVSEVLESNLDLLVDRGDEGQALRRLKTASDRLIEVASARRLSTGTIGP